MNTYMPGEYVCTNKCQDARLYTSAFSCLHLGGRRSNYYATGGWRNNYYATGGWRNNYYATGGWRNNYYAIGDWRIRRALNWVAPI